MSFQRDKISQFKEIFKTSKNQILNQPGCLSVELLQSRQDPSTFFTHSTWEKEEDLNNYRKSAFFGQVWPATKLLFKEKPEAWTLDKH